MAKIGSRGLVNELLFSKEVLLEWRQNTGMQQNEFHTRTT